MLEGGDTLVEEPTATPLSETARTWLVVPVDSRARLTACPARGNSWTPAGTNVSKTRGRCLAEEESIVDAIARGTPSMMLL